MIEVENLTKNYGPFQALKGISFRIDKGEVIGFWGQMVLAKPPPCGF